MSIESLPARPSASRNPEAVAIGVLFAFVVGAHVWTALVVEAYAPIAAVLPSWAEAPFVLGNTLTYVVGFSLAAVAYVRFRDVDVPTRLPDRDALPTALAAVLAPVALVAFVAVVANVAFDATLSAVVQMHYSPEAAPSFVAGTVVVPALFGGVGYGLLYYGAVQGRLRDLFGPAHAVALTTVVAGFFRVAPMHVPSVRHADLAAVPPFVTMVALSVAFGLGVGLVYRGTVRDDPESIVGVWQVPVLVVAVLTLGGIALTFAEVPQGVVDALWVVTFGVAAVAAERTRSVWVPMAVVGALELAIGLAAYAEALLGVTAPPL